MKSKILGVALATIIASSTAQAIVIDDFSGDEFVSATAPLNSVSAGNSIDGFARTVTSTSSGEFTSVAINSGPNLGLFAHSQDAGVMGYSRIDFALGGIDLTEADTINAFRLSINSIDLDGQIGIIVDGASVALGTTPIIVANGGVMPSYADFLFSDFNGIDFTNVNQVSFFVDGSNIGALDVTIDHFGTTCSDLAQSGGAGANPELGVCPPPTVEVSEPFSFGLLGLGLTLWGLGRRRTIA